MGVDCKIYLPDNVRIRDVAHVIAISAGLKPRWGGSGKAKWVEVPVEVRNTSYPSMAEIAIYGDLVDGEKRHFVYYHFECSKDGRQLMPRSTAFWIAIAHKLVDFFGGTIDYNDCDDVDIDYSKDANSRLVNAPEGNKEWDAFQERLFNVKPITKEELEHYDIFAAYKAEEMKGCD